MTQRSKEWIEPWHVNPSGNRTYDFIDGLRGIAILLVVGCHLVYYNPEAGRLTRFVGEIFGAGTYGVTIFFALSGFLISWPFWKNKVKGSAAIMPRGYGWRRFWKVYPPLALSVILLTPIYYSQTPDSGLWKLAMQWLIGWPLFHPVSGQINPVMWSMIVEIHFYLILPVLFFSVKRLPVKVAMGCLLGVLLVVPTAFRLVQAHHGVYFQLHPEIQTHFPAILDSFAFGVLVAGLDNLGVIKRDWAKAGDLGLVLIAGAIVLSAWLKINNALDVPLRGELMLWVVKVGAALALCYVGDAHHPRVRLLSSQWLRWCGIISYELYLFHQPIAVWARAMVGQAGGNLFKYGLIVGGSLVASLILAAVVYRWFSLPLLRQGRAKHRAEPARQVTSAPAQPPNKPSNSSGMTHVG